MDTTVITNGLGQLGSFFKVINKNDWAEDSALASGVVVAIKNLLDATGGHLTLDTLRTAALYTAAGVLAKAAISLLTALHVLKADVPAVAPVVASQPPII